MGQPCNFQTISSSASKTGTALLVRKDDQRYSFAMPVVDTEGVADDASKPLKRGHGVGVYAVQSEGEASPDK